MRLDDFLKHDSEWLRGTGPNSDIVMSSRTRLARNLDKLSFSQWADKRQQETILSAVLNAAKGVPYLKDAIFLRLKDVSEVDRLFLVERHLMSPEHTKDVEFKALLIDTR